MKVEDLNKAKIPVVKINKKLEEFKGKILFPEKLELAKDIVESLAAHKIGGARYIMSSEEVELAYEVFNDYIARNDEASVDVKLPFDVIQSLKEVS